MHLFNWNRKTSVLNACVTFVGALALAVLLGGCATVNTAEAPAEEVTQEEAAPQEQEQDSSKDKDAGTQAEDEGTSDDSKTKENEAKKPAKKKEEKAPKRDYSELEASINEVLAPYEGEVSVVFAPLDDPNGGVRINQDTRMRSASMIKVPILATLLEKVETGEVSLETEHTLTWEEIVGGTGSLQGRGAGAVLTVDKLAWHMIAESDNTATNVLIDLLGFDAVNDTAKRLELTQTALGRKMMDYDAIARGEDNFTCAKDLATLFLMIGREELVSPEQSQRAVEYLKAQTDALGIAQGLPEGTVFAHKTGVLEDVRHDGGIVYPTEGEPYVLVVLCHLPEYTANTVSAEVSRVVWEAQAAGWDTK